MKGNLYLIILLLSLVGFKSSSVRTISGTVRDQLDGSPLPGVSVRVEGTTIGASTDTKGHYSLKIPSNEVNLVFSFIGYETLKVKPGKTDRLNVTLKQSKSELKEVVIVGYGTQRKQDVTGAVAAAPTAAMQAKVSGIAIRGQNNQVYTRHILIPDHNTESYKEITENGFQNPKDQALSTFAVDVDGASYTNLRRFINNGQLPPKDAVRVEEMINYFKYDLEGPKDDKPVAIHTELSSAPWNAQHQLLRIGLKAKEVKTEKLPASNLVFLIDVSGSMSPENRLPLVKTSLKMLVDQLRDKDQVAIVTYAGYVTLALKSTPGSQKAEIKNAIDALGSGGSTAGGAGLKMAYQVARENFKKEGNNRIIMATDGDFNVGASSDKDMEDLIVQERESGVNISVLGFGMGNLKDSKMETIADKGRGNYAYIDNITEARKAMVTEFGGTLFTLAKDVKIQVEFNPGKVQAYRLIGYENRLMAKEDFNNDKKIGGDIGVGHTVTALYEIIPVGVTSDFTGNVDPLKYQKSEKKPDAAISEEVATIKFRYKDPHSDKSRLEQVVQEDKPISFQSTSADFRFASAVAEFGMLLRNSEFKQASSFDKLISRAKGARGKDDDGYRAEFVRLAESAAMLSKGMELAKDSD
ncbi:vWA domain-containing protein [Desertivirga arenae]|uniref:vWA domain-containing protein n=1 Tax=Desertivirga arenae TaxID=2810309 RepID=UPI001A976BC6|nr:VWA domain-containing protein [Pedobacter sp. SYSU D00823]